MWSTIKGTWTFSTITSSGKQNQDQSSTMIEQYLGSTQSGSVEGHELASLWPHPWPQGQVFSRLNRVPTCSLHIPALILPRTPELPAYFQGLLRPLLWGGPPKSRQPHPYFYPSAQEMVKDLLSERCIGCISWGIHIRLCTGKARSLDWEGYLRLEVGSFFALYLAECKGVWENSLTLWSFIIKFYLSLWSLIC